MQCLKREGGEGSMLALLPQVVSGCPVKQFRFHVVLRHHNLKHSVPNNKIIYQMRTTQHPPARLGVFCSQQNLDRSYCWCLVITEQMKDNGMIGSRAGPGN